MKIEITTNGATTADFETLDKVIKIETERKISRVNGAYKYGITTACFIDGEFRLVSAFDVPQDIAAKLERA